MHFQRLKLNRSTIWQEWSSLLTWASQWSLETQNLWLKSSLSIWEPSNYFCSANLNSFPISLVLKISPKFLMRYSHMRNPATSASTQSKNCKSSKFGFQTSKKLRSTQNWLKSMASYITGSPTQKISMCLQLTTLVLAPRKKQNTLTAVNSLAYSRKYVLNACWMIKMREKWKAKIMSSCIREGTSWPKSNRTLYWMWGWREKRKGFSSQEMVTNTSSAMSWWRCSRYLDYFTIALTLNRQRQRHLWF